MVVLSVAAFRSSQDRLLTSRYCHFPLGKTKVIASCWFDHGDPTPEDGSSYGTLHHEFGYGLPSEAHLGLQQGNISNTVSRDGNHCLDWVQECQGRYSEGNVPLYDSGNTRERIPDSPQAGIVISWTRL